MSVGLSACLLPPPVEQLPVADNSPPRILPGSLNPGPSQRPTEVADACPDLDEDGAFSASVFDPDGDTIYWRVFVDYYAGLNNETEVKQVPADADNAQLIDFDLPQRKDFADENPHTVELLIADRQFIGGRVDNEGRELVDEVGLTDSFVWPVVLDEFRDQLCP
jgi:hypothetical protein